MMRLAPLIGEWRLEASLADGPAGHVSFEWLAGEAFVVQRWEVPVPEAPDGIAIIGPAPEGVTYLQHYFDSRGVARIYQMSFDGREWRLSREVSDFSPLDFSQRFTGELSPDGASITGRWEISDDGSSWERDFDLTYTRIT